jgi:hypothetical protein
LKEALLTTRLLNCPAFRHLRATAPLVLDTRLLERASKRTSRHHRASIPGKRKNFTFPQKPSNSGMFFAAPAIS